MKRWSLSEKTEAVDGWYQFLRGKVRAGFSGPGVFGAVPQDLESLPEVPQESGHAFLRQVHGGCVHHFTDAGSRTGDGLFTARPGLILTIRTADCLPLYFVKKAGSLVGLVHMGWRSAAAGILGRVPGPLAEFQVIAGIGLRRCCYEVARSFLDGPLAGSVHSRGGKLFFDPVSFASAFLRKRGLANEDFISFEVCSRCSPMSFPSYRRNRGAARTISYIEIQPE
ncbi:MAG: hypothetical protein GF333_06305 [Candidatus Omnitrophica bacterium]|nr:hypothetical protein [Candidatus Omnitrophota bacterium]